MSENGTGRKTDKSASAAEEAAGVSVTEWTGHIIHWEWTSRAVRGGLDSA